MNQARLDAPRKGIARRWARKQPTNWPQVAERDGLPGDSRGFAASCKQPVPRGHHAT
jgi:hypothetical protein